MFTIVHNTGITSQVLILETATLADILDNEDEGSVSRPTSGCNEGEKHGCMHPISKDSHPLAPCSQDSNHQMPFCICHMHHHVHPMSTQPQHANLIPKITVENVDLHDWQRYLQD
eukprot:c17486_g1_i1 orf=136-480(-)